VTKKKSQTQRAAELLDNFYARLREWYAKKSILYMPSPTWRDIQAALVLVNMKTYDLDYYIRRMEIYFKKLDDILERARSQPSFTHFLDNINRL